MHPLLKGVQGFWVPLPHLVGGHSLYDIARGHHATLTNMDPATDWVSSAGAPFAGLHFDGTDDVVAGGDVAALDGLSALSVSATVRLGNTAADHCVISKGTFGNGPGDGGWMLYFDQSAQSGSQRWSFIVQPQEGSTTGLSRVESTTSFTDTSGVHRIGASYDGAAGELTMWIDGRVENTASIGVGSLPDVATPLERGRNSTSGRHYGGHIFDVYVAAHAHDVGRLHEQARRGFPDLLRPRRGVSLFTTSGSTAVTLTAEQGSYSLSGQTAGLLAGRLLTSAQGDYSLTGQDAALLAFRTLAAEKGTYTLTGKDAELLRGLLLAAERGDYAQTGQAAMLLANRLLSAEQGSYSASGQPAALVYSGAELLATLEVALSDTMTLSPALNDTITLEPTLKD